VCSAVVVVVSQQHAAALVARQKFVSIAARLPATLVGISFVGKVPFSSVCLLTWFSRARDAVDGPEGPNGVLSEYSESDDGAYTAAEKPPTNALAAAKMHKEKNTKKKKVAQPEIREFGNCFFLSLFFIVQLLFFLLILIVESVNDLIEGITICNC
jgi:hypothetical protein